jgi:hypothetical protein
MREDWQEREVDLERRETIARALAERRADLSREEFAALILEFDALGRLRAENEVALIEEMWARFPESRDEESIQAWADAKEALAQMPPNL